MTETVVNSVAGQPVNGAPVDGRDADDEPIDEELLEEAQRGFGTSRRNATINMALREYVANKRKRRLEAFDRLQRRAQEDDLNFAAIEEADQ